ncbi:hypothetical protein HID58_094793, partial [Brassica napus]
KPVDIEVPQAVLPDTVLKQGGYEITIVDASNERQVIDIIPRGLELLVSEGESINSINITSNPNGVGGCGNSTSRSIRVQGLLFFLGSVVWHKSFWFLKETV